MDQVNITPAEFAVICPALLVQLEEKACAITTKVEKEHIKNPKQSFSMGMISYQKIHKILFDLIIIFIYISN